MSSGSPNQNNPPPPGSDIIDVVRQLEILVDLTQLQVDLIRATNYILMTNGGKTPPVGLNQYGRGSSGDLAGSLDRMFSKYFSKESSYVDPSQGLSRWAGIKSGRAWKGSRSRRYGTSVGRFAKGAVTSLGGGDKLSGIAGTVGAVIGKAVGAVISFAEVMLKARNALHAWTENVFQTAERLSQVSGSMAAVVAQRQVDQINRDIQRGEATAGSASRLQKAESGRKEEENKLMITIDNATNNILTVLNNVATPIIAGVNLFVETLKKLPGPIGDIVRALTKKGEVGDGNLEIIGEQARKEIAMMDVKARSLMDIARAAGRVGGGVIAPAGAARPGRVP